MFLIGFSQPTQMSGLILVKEQTAAPDADMGGMKHKLVEGKAGSKILVNVSLIFKLLLNFSTYFYYRFHCLEGLRPLPFGKWGRTSLN